MIMGDDKSPEAVRALIRWGRRIVVGHLKQTFDRHFKADVCFNYPHLGRQGKIMYSNCSLEFQRLHRTAIEDERYVASMVSSISKHALFSPWSSGAGFYVSCYSDFAALWSWVGDPEDGAYKNLECQGWHGELIHPVVEYARSIGKLEVRLKHSGDVLSKMQNTRDQDQKGGEVVDFRKRNTT